MRSILIVFVAGLFALAMVIITAFAVRDIVQKGPQEIPMIEHRIFRAISAKQRMAKADRMQRERYHGEKAARQQAAKAAFVEAEHNLRRACNSAWGGHFLTTAQPFAQSFLSIGTISINGKNPSFLAEQRVRLELIARFELATSSLPRMRSTY